MIKVGVLGAKGRMGSQVCSTVESADDLSSSRRSTSGTRSSCSPAATSWWTSRSPAAVMDNLRWCIERGLAAVVGTSGFDDARLAEVAGWLAGQPAAACSSCRTSPSAPC